MLIVLLLTVPLIKNMMNVSMLIVLPLTNMLTVPLVKKYDECVSVNCTSVNKYVNCTTDKNVLYVSLNK